MGKNKKISVEIAKRFKITLHNQDMHAGCYYIEDDWEIVIYAVNMRELAKKVCVEMVQRLMQVDGWELEQCEVILYNDELYEITSTSCDIKDKHQSLINDIISMKSYKKAFAQRKKELIELQRKLKKKMQEQQSKEDKKK